ncbi:hypothetical protein IFR05_009605 [Cadophora sp. M221]|nr:hypothetical protein IFR05_009605 [Cadophora sp. M221]
MADAMDRSLGRPSLRLFKRSAKQVMLSRFLKDYQRHEMLACNCNKLFPKEEIKAVRRNLSKVLPELAGIGAWCRKN